MSDPRFGGSLDAVNITKHKFQITCLKCLRLANTNPFLGGKPKEYVPPQTFEFSTIGDAPVEQDYGVRAVQCMQRREHIIAVQISRHDSAWNVTVVG